MSEVIKMKKLSREIIKLLEHPVSDDLKEAIRKGIKREDMLELLGLMELPMREFDAIMKSYANVVKVRAKQQGIQLLDHKTACYKKKGWCGTCLSNLYGGRYKTHYPYYMVKTKAGLVEGDRKNGWKRVRDYQQKDFLRQFLSEEDVQDHFTSNDLRIAFYRLHNYYMLLLKHVGLIEEKDIE